MSVLDSERSNEYIDFTMFILLFFFFLCVFHQVMEK